MAIEESTFFIPEHSTSPLPCKSRSSKRVTFQDPSDLPTDQKSLEFLYRPSVLKPVRVAHALPEREIKDLEKSVDDLGVVHVNDLRKLEKEHREYWSKKKGLIEELLQMDA